MRGSNSGCAKRDNRKGKGRSRFPEGMTERTGKSNGKFYFDFQFPTSSFLFPAS